MAPLTSFAAWLRDLPAADFADFCRTRRDLMRTDLPHLREVAAAASSRAGVASALESLDTNQLQVIHRAARATRVDPAVPAAVLDADAQTLTALTRRGLLWPIGPETYRTHAETMSLLPTSAAELRTPDDWVSAEPPTPPARAEVSAGIAANAEAAAASGIITGVLGAVEAFSTQEVSQLTSGGAGRRDMQAIARRLGASLPDAVTYTELAAAAGLLAVGGTEIDPRWLPSAAFDAALTRARAEVYAELLHTWLAGTVDTTHILDGRTAKGDRIQSLAASAGLFRRSAYAGFPVSQPPLPHARFALLDTLAALTADPPEGTGPSQGDPPEGTAAAPAPGAAVPAPAPGAAVPAPAPALGAAVPAVADAALIAHVRFAHPLLPAATEATLTRLLAEAALLGLVCTPLDDAHAHGLTPLGRLLITHLRAQMSAAHALTGFDASALSVPADLQRHVEAILPELQRQVVVQSDLTAVATGPLDPHIHGLLTGIAEVDTRGQGTVYRFTETTIADALKSGLTAADITASIREAAGSAELPQPLEFLIEDTAGRLGRIRIAAARSVLIVDDPAELAGMLADSALIPAALTRLAPTVAVANVSRERLAMLLDAAGYQTLAADPERPSAPRAGISSAHSGSRPAGSSGAGADAARAGTAPSSRVTRRTTRVPDSRLPAYIAQLRASAPEPETDSPATIADVLREAAATAAEVVLTVVGREGTQRRVRVVPQQVAGGRVRARTGPDLETEMTFGLARIISAVPAADETDTSRTEATGASGADA